MSFQHTILITAAEGHIGSQPIPLLVKERQVKLVLPISNAQKLQCTLAVGQSTKPVTVEEGSIQDLRWLESIIRKHSVDTVFLNLTGADELMTALNFLNAMQRARTVKHLVYLSACGDFTTPAGYKNALATHTAAHVLVKPLVETKLIEGGFPWTTTVVGPKLFWDNDLRSKS